MRSRTRSGDLALVLILLACIAWGAFISGPSLCLKAEVPFNGKSSPNNSQGLEMGTSPAGSSVDLGRNREAGELESGAPRYLRMATFSSGRQLPTLCIFYEKGWCKSGDQCRFTHGKSDSRELTGSGVEGAAGPAASILEPCKFFAVGKCVRGQACPFLHSPYLSDEEHRRKVQARIPAKRSKSPERVPSRQREIISPPCRKDSHTPSATNGSTPFAPVHPEDDTGWRADESSNSGGGGSGWGSGGSRDDVHSSEELETSWYSLTNDEGVYFYGAPGRFDEPPNDVNATGAAATAATATAQRNRGSWRDVVGQPGEDLISPTTANSTDPDALTAALALVSAAARESAVSKPLSVLRTAKHATCTFFLRGMCRFGDRCRHSHDVQPWDDTEKTTTVYSKEFFGKDGYMESTADSEAKGGWSDAEEKSVATACEASLDEEEVAQSRRAECGVCLERVKERFGILVGCKHVYCLKCIREWRSKSNNRECPQCRVVSYFVVPSVKLVTDPERKECLVAKYKESLASIPCQHFEYGVTECPFGSSCFYSHSKPDGTSADTSAPRIRLTDSGESEPVRDVILSSFMGERF